MSSSTDSGRPTLAAQTSGSAEQQSVDSAFALPTVTLPKGGGAIRGIGEKFGSNPVTGTGTLTVPIATSPGRSGFGPSLTLSYDSGSGNGPFGFGWSLSLPMITRKTDKGLPQYLDTVDSDVFLLSGSEDLVPVVDSRGARIRDLVSTPGYSIERYRPRTEGLFARIERWTRADGDVHWRSISKDNILTIYGLDASSRIADASKPSHIFSWLICESRDDRGNAVVYDYKSEDGVNINLARACERNRGASDAPARASNRYLKHVRYCNRETLLDSEGRRPQFLTAAQVESTHWLFEVVLDYGEHNDDAPMPDDPAHWPARVDPFSSYRPGFEVRTNRLCRRVLMFHHFPDEANVGADCLVRSTDFTYSPEHDPDATAGPVYSMMRAVTQSGYVRQNGSYLKRSLPAVEFEYSLPAVQDTLEEVDSTDVENLPIGVDGTSYQWTDLHGEGIPGVLTEQADAWFYKRNLSPIADGSVAFAPLERVATRPNLVLAGGQGQFMDLAGDGQPDVVVLDGPTPGFYEHDDVESWLAFRPFSARLNRSTRDPNLKFVDLDGDGHADVLIAEDDAFVWHPSLAEDGFGPARSIARSFDEEKGPRLVFADGTQSIYLADFSGDGLSDLARIRNGDVCYWPNLGYGRFGAKVAMDHAPQFDNPDQFDQKRIRLADIDGTGTTDLIYLHRDGVQLYSNQSGNSWSEPQRLNVFPHVDELDSIAATDLLGNGTACLVWSSPLPGDAHRPMRYVNLMGGQKPHLLVKTINNLGAETLVQYAPSTKFYLQDKRDGTPWVTRLPFPVHVVERIETLDRISRNRFVTRHAYHHGYFDGVEREFRGFGMVEQWDTEEFAALTGDGLLPAPTNVDLASHVPPVLTKTWFHTGVYLGRDHISNFFAGLLDADDKGEYYREPGLTDAEARALLLPDTVLPTGLTPDEEREACRALKGSMLRQEVYALDGSAKAEHPYTVSEQTFSIRTEQPRWANRHAVFHTHVAEALTYHYERNPEDPRVQHALTLELDAYGNVLKEAAVGYGRRKPDASLPLPVDRDNQTNTLVTYTEHQVSNAVDDIVLFPDGYRVPLSCETRTYELTGYSPSSTAGRFKTADFVASAGDTTAHVFDSEINYEDAPTTGRQRRVIEQIRTVYRRDDLTSLLPFGSVESLALIAETYKLAFTPGLLAQVFVRDGVNLLPDPAAVLGGQGGDQGGYVASQQLKADGRFPSTDPDGHWWIPSGRVFLSPNADDPPNAEREHARLHFFLPLRARDPFHTNAVSTEHFVTYDSYDLLSTETKDAVGNRVTVGERRPDGTIDETKSGNDYRVLRATLVMDPNRNRTEVAIDALGMVVGTAVMGKPEERLGDSLAGFVADLTEADTLAHLAGPLLAPNAILGRATTRLVYDLFAYQRTSAQPDPQPAVVYTLARETHDADLLPGEETKVQHGFSYSDGLGREIQNKMQAKPGPLMPDTPMIDPRWVGTGWTIFNNKGKPVRQYEPFFSATHRFEFGVMSGVSPILFYDPVDRVVATLRPNHTYEKVVFGAWSQATWDANDTVLLDPRTDSDVDGYTAAYFGALSASPPAPSWDTWRAQRQGGALGGQEQRASDKAALHAATPTTGHFDSLGRAFLTLADNGPAPAQPGRHILLATRTELDVEGNPRTVRDAVVQAGDEQGRVVTRSDHDVLGHRIRHLSMEAGARWTVNDVTGNAIRAWDSQGRTLRTEHDPLRRVLRSFVTGIDADHPEGESLTERLVYGEQHANAELANLRGKISLHLDQAGSLATETHDFKGNALRTARCITSGKQYRQGVDWSSVDADRLAFPVDAVALSDSAALAAALAPRLEPDAYVSRTTYDAFNRPVLQTTPSTPSMRPSVIRLGYNEAHLLERVDVNLRSAADANGDLVWSVFVDNIDYDAKGQRQSIVYGNAVTTAYEYDRLTFRLASAVTRRDVATFPDDSVDPPPAGWPGKEVQNLSYTYDPVGNITSIRDEAQQTIFFNNQRIEPTAELTYDAIYRLIAATGREHLGQIGGASVPYSFDDAPRLGVLSGDAAGRFSPNDGQAMASYVEQYVYDEVGNIVQLQHRGSGPANAGWTRSYAYNETSLIENGNGGTALKRNNRLSTTTVGSANAITERYTHDAHGNMTRMPHLGGAQPDPNMFWDYRDQLQAVDRGGGGTAYYAYDARGHRVRKVWEKSDGLVEERLYLGGLEIYRRRQGAELLERETVLVMDDARHVALIDTRTIDTAGTDAGSSQLVRYQFANHIGSASLELDDHAGIISYEEYTPYGSTSYQAVRSQTEVPKRYRYVGMERDDESGLSYHVARYYASWLGRWASCDPSGIKFGADLYVYGAANPIVYHDVSGRDPTAVAIGAGVGGGAVLGEGVTFAAVGTFLVSNPIGWGILAVGAIAIGVGVYKYSRPERQAPTTPRPETRPLPQPDRVPDSKPEERPVPKPEPSPQPDVKPQPKPEPKPLPKPETVPKPEPKPQPRPDTGPKPEPNTQTKPDTAPKPETKTKPQTTTDYIPPREPQDDDPNVVFVVRAGVATPEQLIKGVGPHEGVTGFSVQSAPGKTVRELAAAGRFPNGQISVTTVDALLKVGVPLVKTSGMGYHNTAVTPMPLSREQAAAISAVFIVQENLDKVKR